MPDDGHAGFQSSIREWESPAVDSEHGLPFVVTACGGGKIGTKSGDAQVAFALRE
jgi:quinoprotein glucose dehydrogenase